MESKVALLYVCIGSITQQQDITLENKSSGTLERRSSSVERNIQTKNQTKIVLY
jgi:hypothetical protein